MMVDIYAKLIIAKRRSFEQVPSKFKNQVRDRLLELGYDTNGDPITLE